MPEKLFSYGALQIETVQLETFGRKLVGRPDVLTRYEIRNCLIEDTKTANAPGKVVRPVACFTGNPNDEVPGTVFEATEEEMLKADKYEGGIYKRAKCVLKSGNQVWVHVQSVLNIDIGQLRQGQIRLWPFEDKHVPALCKKAQDPRIWEHHRSGFHRPEIFKSARIAKAKEEVANRSRYEFVVDFQEEIIGATSYYDVDLKHRTMYIGHSWLHPDYWGKGINAAVKKLMLSCAFEQLKFKRVSFCIDSENLRSRRAIEKLGVPFEGILKKHQIRPDGSSRDSAVYAMTDELWKSQKNILNSTEGAF